MAMSTAEKSVATATGTCLERSLHDISIRLGHCQLLQRYQLAYLITNIKWETLVDYGLIIAVFVPINIIALHIAYFMVNQSIDLYARLAYFNYNYKWMHVHIHLLSALFPWINHTKLLMVIGSNMLYNTHWMFTWFGQWHPWRGSIHACLLGWDDLALSQCSRMSNVVGGGMVVVGLAVSTNMHRYILPCIGSCSTHYIYHLHPQQCKETICKSCWEEE